MAILGTAISLIRHSGEWCNWQHSRFWFCYSGFDSLLPNFAALRVALLLGSASQRPVIQSFAMLFIAIALHCYLAPSSSGLGHHPLKVAARVRIPLGLLNMTVDHRHNCRLDSTTRSNYGTSTWLRTSWSPVASKKVIDSLRRPLRANF